MQNQLCHQMSTKRINDASNIFPQANIKQLSVRTRVCNRQELYVDRTPLRLEKKEKKTKTRLREWPVTQRPTYTCCQSKTEPRP